MTNKPPEGAVSSDYTAIGRTGKYRNINDPDNIIPRYQYEKLKTTEAGWLSVTERNNARKSSEYKRWIRGSLDSKAPLIMPRDEFEQLYIAAKRDNDFNNTDYDGSFAKLLVSVGLRDADATYPVGQTPKKGRR